jgi:hypothetical protein
MNDMSAKRELHDAARDLYTDKAFLACLDRLRKTWFAELITLADTTDRKLELVAQMKALDAIPRALKGIMEDYTQGTQGRINAS